MNKSVTAVILAAGKGLRMGGAVPKQFMELEGRPVLAHTLLAFEAAPSIDSMVIVSDNAEWIRNNILKPFSIAKPVLFADGGRERQDSVWNAINGLSNCELVAIHDGVRPLVTVDVIEESIAAARVYGAAVVGMPSRDTIKEADDKGFAIRTPDRSRLWTIQTPQTFRLDLLKEAHEKAREDRHLGTDDSSLVERLGHPVRLIEGSYKNIKITTPEDLTAAALYLKSRREKM